MTFYATSTQAQNPSRVRHLYCPRHLSTGPVCGQVDLSTGSGGDRNTYPIHGECEEIMQTGCPICGLPGEFHRSPVGKRVIRDA